MKTAVKTFPTFATANQTVFTPPGGYNQYGLSVFVDGKLLSPNAYTATDGVNIVLNVGLAEATPFQSVSLQPFEVQDPLNAITFNAQPPSYYRNADNLNSGTVPDDRLPARIRKGVPNTPSNSFNALKENGDYLVAYDAAGAPASPSGVQEPFWTRVVATMDGKQVMQTATQHLTGNNTKRRLVRTMKDEVWTNWYDDSILTVDDANDRIIYKPGSNILMTLNRTSGTMILRGDLQAGQTAL